MVAALLAHGADVHAKGNYGCVLPVVTFGTAWRALCRPGRPGRNRMHTHTVHTHAHTRARARMHAQYNRRVLTTRARGNLAQACNPAAPTLAMMPSIFAALTRKRTRACNDTTTDASTSAHTPKHSRTHTHTHSRTQKNKRSNTLTHAQAHTRKHTLTLTHTHTHSHLDRTHRCLAPRRGACMPCNRQHGRAAHVRCTARSPVGGAVAPTGSRRSISHLSTERWRWWSCCSRMAPT